MQWVLSKKAKKNIGLKSESGCILFNLKVLNFLLQCAHTIFMVSNKRVREGVKKNRFFLGKSPKQRTPLTHRYSLGLT